MKKFLALLLMAILVASLLPLAAVAADEPPTKIVWFWREGGDIQLPDDSYISKKVLEDLNIEYIHVTSVGMTPEEKLTQLLVSGEVPDIIDSYGSKTTELRKMGAIIPLDEYLTEEYIPNMMKNTYAWDVASELMRREDGHIWAIPATFAAVSGPTPYIRYDWLRNLGLEVPTTLDELKDVLIAFTKNDPDGNGKDDTWGTSYGGMYSGISTNFAADWNGWFIAEDGTAEWGMMSDRMVTYLQYIADLIAEGGMNPEILDPNELGNGHGDAVRAGQLGFSFSYNGPQDLSVQEDMRKFQPEAEWGPMLPPAGFYDVGYLPVGGILRQEYCISEKAVKEGKLEKILQLMDYMCNDGGNPSAIDYDAPYWEVSYGERGVNWNVTEDGQFDNIGNFFPEIKLNNEGKDYLGGRARRFRTLSMQAAMDSGLNEDQLKDLNFIYAMPASNAMPKVIGAAIPTEGMEFPASFIEMERQVDILWGIYNQKAMLGQIDIVEGLAQLRQDAEMYNYSEIAKEATELFRAAGKLLDE